jgi:hypothetical protein
MRSVDEICIVGDGCADLPECRNERAAGATAEANTNVGSADKVS